MFNPVFRPNTALERRFRGKPVTADLELVLGVGGGGAGPQPTDLEAGKVKPSKVGSFLLSLVLVGVDGTGLIRALKNGTATVTARSGSVSATVAVTVQQAAVLLVVVVRATDAGGAVVEGLSLAFVVQGSGGTVGASPIATDEEGLASTTWTLGTTAGLQQVEVTLSGLASPRVKISATGLAAAAAALVGSSGDLQSRRVRPALA